MTNTPDKKLPYQARLEQFAKWVWQHIPEGYCDIDCGDVQQKLEDFDLIELRPVEEGDSNEWDAEELYYWKEATPNNAELVAEIEEWLQRGLGYHHSSDIEKGIEKVKAILQSCKTALSPQGNKMGGE